jgi:adenylate cyclase
LEKIDLGPVRIPTDPAGLACIDFLGPSHTFPTYSLSDVVLRKLPSAIFKDKLVLIGPTAVGMRDAVMTPFQKAGYPGVEVHATFIDDLLYNHFIRRGIRENLFDLAFILLFTLGAGALLCAVPPARATVILLMLLGIFLWLSYYLFAAHGIWIVASLPVAALAASFGGIVCYRIFVEDWEKRNVRRAFTQYVPRKLISQVMQRSEPLRLGGEEKELTVLFSSVREFTAISESLSLSSLHEILNEYLSEMTDVVFKHGGTLDKFMGDGIMAFWGAPYPQADHAARACRAALEMQQSLPKLQSRWEAQGRPHIEIGVGINTGAVLVGNMGSRRRFNYTVVGASVNLAARLERITNTYGTHLIIGENTYEAVRNEMLARELDLIHVKGRPKPVRIFELLGTRAEADQHRDRIDRFARGLEAYRQEKWTAALAIFEALAADYPQDGPSRFFIERCRALLAQSGVGPGTPPA